jgi:hypothetical protein
LPWKIQQLKRFAAEGAKICAEIAGLTITPFARRSPRLNFACTVKTFLACAGGKAAGDFA